MGGELWRDGPAIGGIDGSDVAPLGAGWAVKAPDVVGGVVEKGYGPIRSGERRARTGGANGAGPNTLLLYRIDCYTHGTT